MFTDYPGLQSWELAHGALALDSDQGFSMNLELLEQAVDNAGDGEILYGVPGVGEHVTITAVLWGTAPWLVQEDCGAYTAEILLFQRRDVALEWARRRIAELSQHHADVGVGHASLTEQEPLG